MPRMNSAKRRIRRSTGLTLAATILITLLGLSSLVYIPTSAQQNDKVEGNQIPDKIVVIAPGSAYRQTNFVADSPGLALIQDPLLVNPWGISMTSSSPFWVANNQTNTSTLYRGDLAGSPLVKNPSPSGVTIPGGLPTGTVANPSTTDFVLPGACSSPPCSARFLFASITGHITGWNPNAPAAGSTTAVIAASHPGHVYTGLAVANNGTNHLYAADFANGRIDVYDTNFALQPAASFPFADPTIPTTLGNTYHPYNIQAIGGSLYVTYAKVGTDGKDEEGIGNGFVRRFNTNGVRDLTFGINNGPLNSPWGLTIAPASFGIFGGALLVGNFGEGNPSIHAFNPTTGAFLGTLQNEAGDGIVIDELWALTFGNGGAGGDPNTLYFSAGIGEEQHGLFGSLKPTTASATSLVQFSTDDISINEGSGHVDITVTRAGDASGTATVNYATFGESAEGHASQKSDYEIALGKLTFAPGETSKTFRILIVDDKDFLPFPAGDEGDETISLVLSNPTGAGLGLGSPNTAQVTIKDNDVAPPSTNPIDDAQFFVRQHYLDFFNREPEAPGFNTLVNQITACGANAQCIYRKRIEVSTSFFTSPLMQETGLLDILTNRAAFGSLPLYGQFQLGTQALQRGVVTSQSDAAAQLEANKQAYFNEFVTRPEFIAKYPATLTNAQYVDALLASAGLSPSQVRLFVVNLTNGQEVPPTTPTTSGGGARPASTGTARLQFNAAQTAMTFTSTVNNIDFTGSQTPADTNDNLAAAHIHAGPTVNPGVNGPVVWGFFGAPFNDNNPNDQVVTPFSGSVGGEIRGKWDAPEGNGTTLAAQLTNLRTGHAYVNFHTNQFGGGEIRGNIPAETALRDSLVAGLNGATETRATVLRKVAEQEELKTREANSAAVLLSFFEYLRRDPETSLFNTLLNRLNAFNGDIDRAGLIRFMIATGNGGVTSEYRGRFGDPATIANAAPNAIDDTANADINTPTVINVLANDTDAENDPLTIVAVAAGTGGTPSLVSGANNTTVTFTPANNFTGTATFTYTISDGTDTDTATVNVTVASLNTAPVNTVPGAQVTPRNTPLAFNGARLISIADSDAGGSPVQVTLSAVNGTITLSTIAGLSFTTGDGTADATMTFTGTISNINAALNGLVFTPTSNFAGAASLQITTNDQGNTGSGGALSDTDSVAITVTAPTFQFSSATYTATEAAGHATITVTRSGDTAQAASVSFQTDDLTGLNNCDVVTGNASQRCDFTAVGGTLSFSAGQTSATFVIPIIDDVYVEGPETLPITLSNQPGGILGTPSTATLTITDNDNAPGAPNPIDQNAFFVRQQYLDFLGREPDAAGLQGWQDVLTNCGTTVAQPCDKIEVSAGFFRSKEFQERGYFIYKFYSAVGRIPLYPEFMPDLAKVSGFLTDQQLEDNKVAFVTEFMGRPDFQNKYGGIVDPTAFVDALLQTVGLPNHPSRAGWIGGLTNSTLTRAKVFRQLTESKEVYDKYFNEAFVIMQYFGYLRRSADASYLAWIDLLNQNPGNYRTMIGGFINSNEYRKRFGP